MQSGARDALAGAILLAIALAWIAGVFWAIPDVADGTRIGPRGFPLTAGVALAALSLLLLRGALIGARRHALAGSAPGEAGAVPIESWALAATFGFLLGHLQLMMWFGFVLGTVAATAGFLYFVLGTRSPRLLIGVPLGLAFGIWLVLGRLMGVYLPHGSMLDPF